MIKRKTNRPWHEQKVARSSHNPFSDHTGWGWHWTVVCDHRFQIIPEQGRGEEVFRQKFSDPEIPNF